jgi:HK97 family phage portal protein
VVALFPRRKTLARRTKSDAIAASPASTPTFSSISRPWSVDGRVIVPDPGLPLASLAGDPYGIWSGQPSVRKVVDFIARNIASIPWNVYERVSDTDRQRVIDHPLADLLRQPGAHTTSNRLWHSLLVDYLLFDRWCVRVLPSADTTSGFELLRIPAPRMRLHTDLWGRVDAVVIYQLDGTAVWADPHGYVFDHGYAVEGADGTPPVETLRSLLEESGEAVAYRRQVWRNGARVPAVVERPLDAPEWASTGARDRWIESFRRFIKGGGKEGGVPLLEDGMKLSKVDVFSPRDTADLEGRQLADAEVASAYHIAPELVGAREGNYSNIDAFRQMLYRDNLGPHITAVEQVLNAMLVPLLDPDRSLYVEANVDVKLRGSFEEEAAVLQSSTGAPWLTRNEARARRNLPAIEGGDELVTPLNVVTGGLASPRDTAPPKSGGMEQKTSPGLAPPATERDALAGDLSRALDQLAAKLDGRDDAASVVIDQDYAPAIATTIAGRATRLAEAGAARVLDMWNPDRTGWAADAMTGWLRKAAVSHAQGIHRSLWKAIGTAGGDTDALTAALNTWQARSTTWAATIATEAGSFGAHDAAAASGLDTKTWQAGDRRHAELDGHTVPIGELFPGNLRWPGDPTADPAEIVGCACRVTYSRSASP